MVIIIQNWSENPRMKLLAVLWKNARANFLACHSKLLRFCPIAMLQNVMVMLYDKVRILVATSVIRPENLKHSDAGLIADDCVEISLNYICYSVNFTCSYSFVPMKSYEQFHELS